MGSLLLLFALVALLGFARAEDLPVLSLPWGKYQGEVFAADEEVRMNNKSSQGLGLHADD
jgi:hypothetical protein